MLHASTWPFRLMVRTLPFHGKNSGSIPLGATMCYIKSGTFRTIERVWEVLRDVYWHIVNNLDKTRTDKVASIKSLKR